MQKRNQLIFISTIVEKIYDGTYPSRDQLLSSLERRLGFRPSRSTLYDYFTELKEEFGVEIKHSRTRGGYHINNADDEVSNLLKYLDSLKLIYALRTNIGVDRYIFPEKHTPSGIEFMMPIQEAIESRNWLSFTYGKFSVAGLKCYTISSYALKEFSARWYLIGRLDNGEMRTFGLDRIVSIEKFDETFEPDPSFDIKKKFEHSFGIYASEEYPIEEIILSFDAEDGGYLKSVPLHHSQEVLIDTPTEFRIKLSIRLTLDFLMEIVSRSWSLKVIAPESLRKRVCEIYEAALERNNK